MHSHQATHHPSIKLLVKPRLQCGLMLWLQTSGNKYQAPFPCTNTLQQFVYLHQKCKQYPCLEWCSSPVPSLPMCSMPNVWLPNLTRELDVRPLTKMAPSPNNQNLDFAQEFSRIWRSVPTVCCDLWGSPCTKQSTGEISHWHQGQQWVKIRKHKDTMEISMDMLPRAALKGT